MESKSIDYFTEHDLIDRYKNKRKNLPREDVEDLYNCFVKFMMLKLESQKEEKMGFHIRYFGSFLSKRLKIENLKKSPDSPQYKRAEEQLHHWLSGHQRLKFE